MAEYIDREAALKMILGAAMTVDEKFMLLWRLQTVPTADVVPVETAKAEVLKLQKYKFSENDPDIMVSRWQVLNILEGKDPYEPRMEGEA